MAEDIYRQIRMAGLLFLVPVIVGVWPVAGFFLGDFLRHRFNGPEYMSLIFAFLGFLAGIVELVAIFKALPKDKKANNGPVS